MKKNASPVQPITCSKPGKASIVLGMKGLVITGLAAILMTAGCASTDVASQKPSFAGKLPRPDHIWVYDFAAADGDIPDHSDFAGHQSEHTTPQTAHQVEVGRKMGALIANELIARIRAMGLQADHGRTSTRPKVNDLVLHGYLISVVEGDATKRVLVGFGQGASELKVAMEGFQMTGQGLRKLGGGTADAGGSKTPGGAVGLAALAATKNPAGLIVSTGMKLYGEETGSSRIEGRVKQDAEEIAEIMEAKFREQCWIN